MLSAKIGKRDAIYFYNRSKQMASRGSGSKATAGGIVCPLHYREDPLCQFQDHHPLADPLDSDPLRSGGFCGGAGTGEKKSYSRRISPPSWGQRQQSPQLGLARIHVRGSATSLLGKTLPRHRPAAPQIRRRSDWRKYPSLATPVIESP